MAGQRTDERWPALDPQRMPYDRVADLPSSVRGVLPKHAQEIYRRAFNNAWAEYRDPARRRAGSTREEVAHRVAWAAVKAVYEKSARGRWRKRSPSA